MEQGKLCIQSLSEVTLATSLFDNLTPVGLSIILLSFSKWQDGSRIVGSRTTGRHDSIGATWTLQQQQAAPISCRCEREKARRVDPFVRLLKVRWLVYILPRLTLPRKPLVAIRSTLSLEFERRKKGIGQLCHLAAIPFAPAPSSLSLFLHVSLALIDECTRHCTAEL